MGLRWRERRCGVLCIDEAAPRMQAAQFVACGWAILLAPWQLLTPRDPLHAAAMGAGHAALKSRAAAAAALNQSRGAMTNVGTASAFWAAFDAADFRK